MSHYAWTKNDQGINILHRNKMWTITVDDKAFELLSDFLASGVKNDEELDQLVDKETFVKSKTYGWVTIEGGVVYFAGSPVHNSLTEKLVTLVDEGLDPAPWARFMENVNQNPSYKSRESLFDFLDKWQAPITPDGHFIAFKNVRSDFFDIHSGTMDNSPGNVVSMVRSEVNDDSNQTCSAGLHCCATSYLNSFYVSGGKTVIVKVHPRDVVSVPADYNHAKMRVCRYEVLAEVEGDDIQKISEEPIYDEDPYADDYDDYDMRWQL